MRHPHKFLLLLLGIAAAFALTACTEPDQNGMQQQDQQQDQEPDQAPEQDVPPGEPEPMDERALPEEEQEEEKQPEPPPAIPAPDNVAAAPGDANVTDKGVAWIVIEDAGGDVHPTTADTVVVHYTGWTTDGKMFDSSVARGRPATFPLGGLIPGWQEAVPLMTVGDIYRFWIPGELAYDNSTRPGAPKGTLVFDIELLGVKQPAEPQPAAATTAR